MLGNSPHGYIERLRCRRTSRLFSGMNVLLFSSDDGWDDGCMKINRYTMDISRFLKPEIPTYDLDDMRWIKTPDLRKGNCKLFQMTPRILRNPFTFKLSYWDTKVKHWVQRSELPDDLSISPIKVMIPKIPTKMLGIIEGPSRRGKDVKTQSAMTSSIVMPSFIRSLCKEIRTDVNRHIVSLSLKDSYCSTSEFELIAKALPDTQIVKLNISSHWCDEDLRIGSLFLNAHKLEHLNVNYCGCLSGSDRAAFVYMLMNPNKLHTLKFIFTEILDNTELLLKLCGHSPQLKRLAISLPCDAAIYDLENVRIGNIESVHITSPHTEAIQWIDQRWLTKYLPEVSSNDFAKLQSFVSNWMPELFPSKEPQKKKRKLTVHEQYARRNQYRNQFTKEDRTCRSCGFVWPVGSLKIQTFEGLQSKCKLTNKRCAETSHAAKLSID